MVVPVKIIRNGYTMFELIVVLLLIGILVAYAIPNLNKTTDSGARKAALQATAEGVSLVKNAYTDCMIDGDEMNEINAGSVVLDRLFREVGSDFDGISGVLDLGDGFSVTLDALGTEIYITGNYTEPDGTIITSAETKTLTVPLKKEEQ